MSAILLLTHRVDMDNPIIEILITSKDNAFSTIRVCGSNYHELERDALEQLKPLCNAERIALQIEVQGHADIVMSSEWEKFQVDQLYLMGWDETRVSCPKISPTHLHVYKVRLSSYPSLDSLDSVYINAEGSEHLIHAVCRSACTEYNLFHPEMRIVPSAVHNNLLSLSFLHPEKVKVLCTNMDCTLNMRAFPNMETMYYERDEAYE